MDARQSDVMRCVCMAAVWLAYGPHAWRPLCIPPEYKVWGLAGRKAASSRAETFCLHHEQITRWVPV